MRFVVLHHTGWPSHSDHYDLMLDRSDGGDDAEKVLMTFGTKSDEFPNPGAKLRRLADHRRAYLYFEGPLSAGRGTVKRADEGGFQMIDGNPERMKFVLNGMRLKGTFTLTPAGSDA